MSDSDLLGYRGLIIYIALRLLGSPNFPYYLEIEDLVQEGYIAILKGVKEFNPEKGSLRGFLYTKIKCRLMDKLNFRGTGKGRRARRSIDRSQHGSDFINQHPEILSYAPEYNNSMGVAFAMALEKSLNKIPESERAIIIDSFINDKTNAQIAEERNIGVNSVYSMKYQGIKSIRKVMGLL